MVTRFAKQLHVWTTMAMLLLLANLCRVLQNPVFHDDGLRHIVMAKQMRIKGIFSASWSDFFYEGMFTVRNVDPWWLYHVLIMPFSQLSVGAATDAIIVVFAALLSICFLLALNAFDLSARTKAICMILLFAGEATFTSRLFLARPLLPQTCLGILMILAVLNKKPVWAGIILFFSCLLSHVFVFPLLICMTGVFWLVLRKDTKEAGQFAIAACAGIPLSILIRPDGFEYVWYLHSIFMSIPLDAMSDRGDELREGISRGLPFAEFLLATTYAAFFNGVTDRKRRSEILASKALFPAILCAGLSLGLFFWVRIIDLLWPVSLIFCAAVLADDSHAYDKLLKKTYGFGRKRPFLITTFGILIATVIPRSVDYAWIPLLFGCLYVLFPSVPSKKDRVPLRGSIACICLLILMNTAYILLWFIPTDAQKSLDAYDLPSEIPAGAHVLNTEWSYFPVYVTVRSDLRYATGMDPAFLAHTKPALAAHLRTIRLGYMNDERIAVNGDAWTRTILSLTDPQYLLLKKSGNEKLIASLNAVTRLRRMRSGENIAVYEVLDVK